MGQAISNFFTSAIPAAVTNAIFASQPTASQPAVPSTTQTKPDAATGVPSPLLSMDKSEYINIPKTIASRIEYPPESRKSQALAALFLFANQEYELEQHQMNNNNNNENIHNELFHCNETIASIAAASYSIADSLKAFDEQEQVLFQKMEDDAKINRTNASGHTDTHLAPIAYRYITSGCLSNQTTPIRALTVFCGVRQTDPRTLTCVAAGDIRFIVRYIDHNGPDAEIRSTVSPSGGSSSCSQPLMQLAIRFHQLYLMAILVKLGLRGTFESYMAPFLQGTQIIGHGNNLSVETKINEFFEQFHQMPTTCHLEPMVPRWRHTLPFSQLAKNPLLPPAYMKFWYEVGIKTALGPRSLDNLFVYPVNVTTRQYNGMSDGLINAITALPEEFGEYCITSTDNAKKMIKIEEQIYVKQDSLYLVIPSSPYPTDYQNQIERAEDNQGGTIPKNMTILPSARIVYQEMVAPYIDFVPLFYKFAAPGAIDEEYEYCYQKEPLLRELVIRGARRLPGHFLNHLQLFRRHFVKCGANPLLPRSSNCDVLTHNCDDIRSFLQRTNALVPFVMNVTSPLSPHHGIVAAAGLHRKYSAALLATQTNEAYRALTNSEADLPFDEDLTATLRAFGTSFACADYDVWGSLATHGAIDCWESENIDDDANNDDGFVRRQLAFPSKALDEEFFTLFRSEHRINPGQPCFSSRQEFGAKWNKFAQGILDGYSSPYAWAIGGAVVTCLDPNITEASTPASMNRDIDIVFAGLTPLGVNLELVRFDNFIRTKFPTIRSPDDESSKLGHLACHTRSTITYVLPFPLPRIQIVLGAWSNIETCLRYSDVDCCGVALSLDLEREENYHSSQQQIQVPNVVCTPRSLHSWIYKVNVVSEHAYAIRGSIQYEMRLLKYARRHGFAVVHHDINPTTFEAVKKLRSPSIQEQLPNMTLTSGVTWLFMADIGKFKPKLDVPSALDVSSTRGLKQVKEQILEDGYVESDNYGQHEEGYQLFSSMGCVVSDEELVERLQEEKAKMAGTSSCETEQPKHPFASHILRPNPLLLKLSAAFPFCMFTNAIDLFPSVNFENDMTLRQQFVEELGIQSLASTQNDFWYSTNSSREMLLFAKQFGTERSVETNGWTCNVDGLEMKE